MSIIELGPVVFGPKLGLIQYLQGKNLLAGRMMCQTCITQMNFQPRDESVCSDGYTWRCLNCYTVKSVRHEVLLQVTLTLAEVVVTDAEVVTRASSNRSSR